MKIPKTVKQMLKQKNSIKWEKGMIPSPSQPFSTSLWGCESHFDCGDGWQLERYYVEGYGGQGFCDAEEIINVLKDGIIIRTIDEDDLGALWIPFILILVYVFGSVILSVLGII